MLWTLEGKLWAHGGITRRPAVVLCRVRGVLLPRPDADGIPWATIAGVRVPSRVGLRDGEAAADPFKGRDRALHPIRHSIGGQLGDTAGVGELAGLGRGDLLVQDVGSRHATGDSSRHLVVREALAGVGGCV